jgi:alpha-tubulin suppressor-like RCC1 family protein
MAVDDAAKLADIKAQQAAKIAKLQAAAGGKPGARQFAPLAAVSGTLNQAGLAAADENGILTPSDSTGAIGPNNYVEVINDLIATYNRTLGRVGSIVSLNPFVNFNSHPGTVTDPQFEWDQQSNRWLYAAVLEQAGANYLFYGWSRTSDPTNLSATGYCQFEVSTGNDFEDYPKLGHDTTGLVIGANLADAGIGGSGNILTGTIFEFKKPANGVMTCTQPATNQWGKRSSGHTDNTLRNADGTPARTPVPANTTDSGPNTYVVAAHSPLVAGFTPKVMVWHITYGKNGSPGLMSDGDVTVPNFNVAANAPQGSSPNYLDVLDTRLTQAVARADPDASNSEAIWTQHTVTEINTPAVVVWYEIIPATMTLRQTGDTLKDIFTSTFNGAISPTIDGNEAVVAYNQSSGTQLASIAVQSRLSSTPLGQLDPVDIAIVATSANPEADTIPNSCGGTQTTPCRWGDYSALTPDPASRHVVWGTNAITGTGPTQGAAGWITRNFAVTTLTTATCRTSPIAGGWYHSVAEGADGTVWAWGLDNNGQVGNGMTVQNEPAPVQVSGPMGIGLLSGITSVAAGEGHSVAVRGSDGTVWAWGTNAYGQLGDLSGVDHNTPVQVVIAQSGGQPLMGISTIYSRTNHTLAIRKSDGSVWAWGLNTSGQLGIGSVASVTGAVQVLGVGGSGFLTGIVAVSAGDSFSVAIDAAGNVYAWGDDSHGQLGDNRFGTGVMSSTPLQVHGLNNVGTLFGGLAIASRANGSEAINSDRTVSAWGTGNQPINIYPVLVAGTGGTGTLFPMVSVGTSWNTTLTVDNNTGLWDWGDNTYGQLGDGTTTFHANAVQVVDVGGVGVMSAVTATSGGIGHALAIKSGGTVAAWGLNTSGQLGDGSTTNRLTAVAVSMPSAAQPTNC